MRKSEARDLKNRIDIGRRLRERVYDDDRKRALRLYAGDHWDTTATDADQITVNYLYPIVETKVAAIAFRYPDFTLRSLTEEAGQNEETSRALLEYSFRRGRFLAEAKRIFRDYQIGALGVGLTGWKTETGKRGEMGTVSTSGARSPGVGEPPDPTENSGEEGAYGGGAPGTLLGSPLAPELAAGVLGEAPSVRGGSGASSLLTLGAQRPTPTREDRPFLKRLAPSDFFVSPECGSDLSEALYCGYTERIPLATVRKHPRWKNTGKLKGNSENLRDLFDTDLKSHEEDDLPADLKRVTIHHYYDRPSLKYCVFSDECDEALYESEWPYPYLRYPFRLIRAADDDDRFWPKPTLLRYEHPQLEINHARSMLAAHQRTLAGRKYQTSARLSNQAKRALLSNGTAALVELDGPEKIGEVPHLHIGPEVFRSWESAREDLQILASMNAYEAFAEPSKRLTTSEVAALQGAGGARARAEQEEFEAFISGVGQDTLALLQEYSVAAGQMPVFRDGKVKDWRDFTLDEIQGEYWVEVFVSSTSVPNKKMLAEQIGLIMQSIPNFVAGVAQGDQAGMNFRGLLRRILEGVPEIRDVDEIVPEKTQGGGGMDMSQIMSQIPPEMMASLGGAAGMPPGAGGPAHAGPQPFPTAGPNGSPDPAAMDAWFRGLTDEDLAGYANGAG